MGGNLGSQKWSLTKIQRLTQLLVSPQGPLVHDRDFGDGLVFGPWPRVEIATQLDGIPRGVNSDRSLNTGKAHLGFMKYPCIRRNVGSSS